MRRLHSQVTSLPGLITMSFVSGRWLAALVFALSLLGASPGAQAGAYEDALQGFVTDDFSDTADAIEKIAASGDPKAAVVLQALQEGRLVYSADEKKVYIKSADEKLTDAATGEAVAQPPSDIDNVRLNNRLRGMVGGMLGGLTLMSPDPGRRYEAAQSVYRSRDAGVLPAL